VCVCVVCERVCWCVYASCVGESVGVCVIDGVCSEEWGYVVLMFACMNVWREARACDGVYECLVCVCVCAFVFVCGACECVRERVV